MHSGIATVSTNFELMGKRIAQLALSRSRDRIYNDAVFTIRDSI